MGLSNTNPDYDPTIAIALMMASMARSLNILPRAGGSLDQEAYTMEWLLLCMQALQKVDDLKNT